MKIKFTKLGKVFGGIALFFYLAAMTSQSMLLLALLGVIAGLFLVNFFTAKKMLAGLELRAPARTLIPEGGKIDQPWQALNTGKAMVQMVSVVSGSERLFAIQKLAPKDHSFHLPEVRLLKRGVYPHQQAQLSTGFPFGLLTAIRSLPLPGETLVYPQLYPVKGPSASGFEAMTGGKFKGARRSAFGSNFAGVRPWVSGDPVKQVHWKSSAKGKGLMVKTFEEELSGKISLLIYLGQKASSEEIDSALRCAGSLMFAALDDGHQPEWVIWGEPPVRKVTAFADGIEILEALARVEPSFHTPSTPAQDIENQLSKRSSLVMVATSLHEDWSGWISGQQMNGRRASIYLPRTAMNGESIHFETHFYEPHGISGDSMTRFAIPA